MLEKEFVQSTLWSILHMHAKIDAIELAKHPEKIDIILQKLVIHSKSVDGKRELAHLNSLLDQYKESWGWNTTATTGNKYESHMDMPALTIQHFVNWCLIALYPSQMIDRFPSEEEKVLIERCDDLYKFISIQHNDGIIDKSLFGKKVCSLAVMYSVWQTRSISDKRTLLEELYLEYQDSIETLVKKGIPLDDPGLSQFVALRDSIVSSLKRFTLTRDSVVPLSVTKQVQFDETSYKHILAIYREAYWKTIYEMIRDGHSKEVFERLKGDSIQLLDGYTSEALIRLHEVEYETHPQSIRRFAMECLTLCQQLDIYNVFTYEQYNSFRIAYADDHTGYVKILQICFHAFELIKTNMEPL